MNSLLDTIIIFLFLLFPKPLGIQLVCGRYLKVSPDLPEHSWNTFRTIGDFPETFSSKEKPLLSYRMSGPNLKKFIFFKDGFPAGHDNYISFLVVSEASKDPIGMLKVSKSISRLT